MFVCSLVKRGDGGVMMLMDKGELDLPLYGGVKVCILDQLHITPPYPVYQYIPGTRPHP